MPDFLDDTQAVEALIIREALENQKAIAAATVRPQSTGECLNPRCCEPFGDDTPGRLFCGSACADEHHKLTKR